MSSAQPWKQNDRYFSKVSCSLMALMKMTEHVTRGATTEVMGLLLGKAVEQTLVIRDSFALPVEGTETRVNAQDEANEFIVRYLEEYRRCGGEENPIGWYHSHPGYGCWLSGIDVATQKLHQQFNDPFVAIVIDPLRTSSLAKSSSFGAKVDIGAFRTLSKPITSAVSDALQRGIAKEKLQDFGAHSGDYYSLPVEYFFSQHQESFLAKQQELNLWKAVLLDRQFVENENISCTMKIEALIEEAETQEHKSCCSKSEFVRRSQEILEQLQMAKVSYQVLEQVSSNE
jgi:COP9 signalosome complex subunit 5